MTKYLLNMGLLFELAAFGAITFADTETSEPQEPNNEVEVLTDRFMQNPTFIDSPTRQLSEKERMDVCRKLPSRYISYYDNVYEVINCKRKELSLGEINQLFLTHSQVTEVNGEVIQALELMPINDNTAMRSCKQFHQRYITSSFIQIYWVENCHKRFFPDWETFQAHRSNLQKEKNRIVEVSNNEISAIAEGTPFPSVLDKDEEGLMTFDILEVLPLSIACRGLIGKHVSYLESIYYITRLRITGLAIEGACQKHLIDPISFTKKHMNHRIRLTELTSSQAFSIPDRKPKP